MARFSAYNKETGSYTPSYRMQKLGAPTIVVSQPYRDPFAPESVKVDISMIYKTPSGVRSEKIKGVSESVAKAISKEVADVVSKARSQESMSKRIEYVSSNYFNRTFGRTSVLLENIANDAGLSKAFKEGMKGRLSPDAQADFDSLIQSLKEITKDKEVMDEFYERTKKYFNILGSKYEKYNRNNRKVNADDTPDSFTYSDIMEIEEAMKKIAEIAKEYEQFVGTGSKYRQLTLTGHTSLRPR